MVLQHRFGNSKPNLSRLGNLDTYTSPKKASSDTEPLEKEPTSPNMSTPVLSPPLKRKSTSDDMSTAKSLLGEEINEKKRRRSKGYAPPSAYSHLPPLPDTISPNLLCVFVGLNPGIQTATKGHPYAHPSNHYWSLLHTSGLTPDRRLAPSEYVTLPKIYSLGNTNIVSRATKDGSQLSKEEMVAGAAVLDKKIKKWKPETVCLVGKGIWEAVWKWKHGRGIRQEEFKYAFQDTSENMGRKKGSDNFFGGMNGEVRKGTKEDSDGPKEEDWDGARVFVATSTSGLAATLSMREKEEVWAKLGEWVQKRRKERTCTTGHVEAAQGEKDLGDAESGK